MPQTTAKRFRPTNEQLLSFYKKRDEHTSMTQKDLDIWFASECILCHPLTQSGIGTMLKRRYEVEQRPAVQKQSKRSRIVDASTNVVEEHLYARVLACQKENIAINYQFLID